MARVLIINILQMRRSIIFTLGWPAAWMWAGGLYTTLPPDSLAASRWGRWHASPGWLVFCHPSPGACLGLICSHFLDPAGCSTLGRHAGNLKCIMIGRIRLWVPVFLLHRTPCHRDHGLISGFSCLPGSPEGRAAWSVFLLFFWKHLKGNL